MFLLCFWMNSTCFQQTWCLLNSRFITFTVLCFIYQHSSFPGSQGLECFPACTGREAGSPVVGASTLKHKRKRGAFFKFIFNKRLMLYECWKSRLHVFYSHVHMSGNAVNNKNLFTLTTLELHTQWLKTDEQQNKTVFKFFKQHWI